MVSLEFFIDIFRPHYGPGVDSASNRKEWSWSGRVGPTTTNSTAIAMLRR